MNDVFLDTVGLIALWDTSDQWHGLAGEAYQRLAVKPARFLTTDLILFECGNASARRPYRARVVEIRRVLEAENLLVKPTAEEVESAWTAYERGEADRAGIIDHVSFQVMRRLGIRRAFTNDRHFTAAGFENLF